MKPHTLLLLTILLASCEALGINDGLSYSYQTQRSEFTVDDTVSATFVNRSQHSLYVFPGCPTVGLEKQTDSSWTAVEIPIYCALVARPPLPVGPEKHREFMLRPSTLNEAEIDPGTYRLTLPIGRKKEEPSEQATSNRFEIVR